MLSWGFVWLDLADPILCLLLVPDFFLLSDLIMAFAHWRGMSFPSIKKKNKTNKPWKENKYLGFLNPFHSSDSLLWRAHGIDLQVYGLLNSCCI